MTIAAVTDETFEQEVLRAEGPVLVDMWAEWCGPCRALSPLLEEIAQEMPGVKFLKMNVDENPQASRDYQVMSIPNMSIFEGGELKGQVIGLQPKPRLSKAITDVVNPKEGLLSRLR